MNRIKTIISLLFLCLSWNAAFAKGLVGNSYDLKVEYATSPIGIDVEKPRFCWKMATDISKRGQRQKAYQIIVKDEQGNKMWDSGKTKSDISLNIEYAGKPLQPATRYHWTLTVWNEKNRKSTADSWFETGLMSTDISAWNGAKWIGGGDDDMVLYSQYLPVFRLCYTMQLDRKSNTSSAAIIYGANDERLMDKNFNIYHIENKRDSSFVAVELDIAPLINGGDAQLNVYRYGYSPKDSRKPLKSFRIPQNIINLDNCYSEHSFNISSVLGETNIYIDGSDKAVASLNVNPLGKGGDFIAFPVVGDIGYTVGQGGKAIFSNVRIANYRSPSNSIVTVDKSKEVTGTIIFSPNQNSSPLLRTIFDADNKAVAKARLYVTARGIYDMYINGERVGDDYFNPGFTQYDKTLMYQTFDVTLMIRKGGNAIGAQLAEGWWSGGITFTGFNWNYFGDRQSLLAKLTITYADGSTQTIVTNPDTWKYYDKSPVQYGSFFQGEVYDTRKEKDIEGWSTAGYDDSKWKKAHEIPLEGNTFLGETNPEICSQYGQSVKATERLVAQSVDEVRPGVFVYDMGQNMAGVPMITFRSLPQGAKVKMRFAEVKYPDLPSYEGNIGMVMMENIRAAMAQDIYISSGADKEVFSPRYTYHGYRYVEITGIDHALPLTDVEGIVLSSIHSLSAHYETSNEKVNRLWDNITWSARANFMSIPTDCPQRNERMGWAGDISVFSRTATYMATMPQFLRRYLQDMRDVQSPEGKFADIAPLGGGFGGILWGSAGITVPWECYQQYGDKRMIAEHYDAMKHYISYILENTLDPQTGIIVQNRAWGDLADWLGPEDGRNDKSLLWEAYFIYDLQLMSKMATILGKASDAEYYGDLCKKRIDMFNNTYIEPNTGKTIGSNFDSKKKGQLIDTQTSYVLPLAFGIVDSSKVVSNLIETLNRTNTAENGIVCPPYSLMTGFIGTAWICKALSDYGHTDKAYKLLQQTEYPSWLYPVEQGATTIWERLNSYTHTDGFGGNNRMNSFNHYSFGAVGAWMCAYSLGIQRDTQSPGFKHFILKPEIDPTRKMTSAKGYYDSMYGRIESSWSISPDGKVTYNFTIPANTTATVILPNEQSMELQSGSYSFVETVRQIK